MIPDIGVMVGAYIFTRMFAVIAPLDNRTSIGHILETIFALITMFIALVVMYDLVTRGASMPSIR